MEIIPRNDKLVVKRCEVEKKVGSLLLPDSAVPEQSNQGIIVAVGPKCDPSLKPGIKILFDDRANEDLDGFLLLNNRDVYGIMQ